MSRTLIKNAECLLVGEYEDSFCGPIPQRLETECKHVLISSGKIQRLFDGELEVDGLNLELGKRDIVIDAEHQVLMPSFVDCHTHACWAGSRLNEWESKLGGKSYLEILKEGGGIMSTVRDVRKATQQGLTRNLLGNLYRMLELGTTTVEVKSGYGLDTKTELKMLRAIADASEACFNMRVVPTACIGHAIDPDVDKKEFVNRTINETLPAVSQEFPGIAIDAYCEEGAWGLEDCQRLFENAKNAGHSLRVHADQFNALGMTEFAVELGFLSVDHLEASKENALDKLALSDTFGVMLPICGLHVDLRFADGRRFLDQGGKLAIATNLNPGSAPSFSMPLAIAAAVRFNRLSPAEAIVASTLNAARLLGFEDVGNMAEGQRADLILLKSEDERDLAFELGGNPVDMTFVNGELVVL